MRQRSYKLGELPRVVQLVDTTRDTWISQAEFTRPNRRVVNLWRIGLLFVDLDTYKVDMRGDPEQIAQRLALHCDDVGIPPPSIVVYSGRGLQAKWLLESPVPRRALPRWNRCQEVIVERLAAYGADSKARDASRVLRLVGATNTKSGEVARVVGLQEQDGEPARYSFEYLCEWLLPVSREKIERRRQQWTAANDEHGRRGLASLSSGRQRQTSGLRSFSGRQLAWHRLEDLRRLADLRGGVREGERMLHLHWQLNFLLLSGATNSQQMWFEAQALARSIDPAWLHEKSALSTLYTKARAFEAGEKVEFNGQTYPALYTPKSSHIIDLFGITDEEQRQLQTIITPALARERHSDREKARRAAAGAIPRDEYLARSKTAREPWRALGISRRTWYRRGCPELDDNPI